MAKIGLTEKVRLLAEVADKSLDRLDSEVLERARKLSTTAGQRLAFSGDATVVALAGATGSGKSTTFNAVADSLIAKTGVRRPTTSKALAAWWDTGAAVADTEALLDWLEIHERHRVVGGARELGSLVLLDLPDHDSVEVAHKMEVDRLVELVDAFVWVLDPQKYADSVVHEEYLKPLAQHADVMLVVLNQIDRVTEAERTQMLKDLRALLDSEGLAKAEILLVSAKTGEGVDALRSRLSRIVQGKKAAAARLHNDINVLQRQLQLETGTQPVPAVSKKLGDSLVHELSEAAGVPAVVEAVKGAWRKRGSEATGWPVLTWLSALRPDPLKRLHLDVLPGVANKALEPVRDQRSSLPAMGGVARSRVDHAVRAIATQVSKDLPRGWADAVREASVSKEATLRDELDLAVSRTDLGMRSGNGWWAIIRVLQWLVMAAMATGVVWLLLSMFFQLPMPLYNDIPIPSILALGGAGVGIVVALLSRIGVEVGAQLKGKQAEAALRRGISKAAKASVLDPVSAEVERYASVRANIEALAK